MRISSKDTIAFIIDFQERLVPVIYNQEELLRNTEILIKGLRSLEVPMIVTQQYTKGIGMTVTKIQEAMGDEFTYHDKISFSCSDNEEILAAFEKSGKKNVIVCGIEAHICVLQTVIDLIAKGYQVFVVEDCIGSRKEKDKNAAIQRAIKEGAFITTYEAILFELTKVAGTAVFKEISKLIK